MYWVGIGWQRRFKACQSLRELDNQCTVCLFSCFFFGHHDGDLVDHIVRGGEPLFRTRGMIAPRSVNMVRHPRGCYIVIPIAVSGVATPENEKTYVAVVHIRKSRHKVPESVLRAGLGRI